MTEDNASVTIVPQMHRTGPIDLFYFWRSKRVV